MGAEHSKEKSVYESVRRGDVESIRSLHRQGAGLHWRSFTGKTPLILACSVAHLLPVAKVLIDLGANVNDYDPEYGVGTALHRAAKRGLEQTAVLLLSHGANPLLCNCFHLNSLDYAREAGHTGIVRAIESHICFFSGWLRGTWYFDDPRLVSAFAQSPRRTWAVVLPSDPDLPMSLTGLKLVLYRDQQCPKPVKVVSLKKFTLLEPVFSSRDPELILSDKSSTLHLKLLSGEEGDKEQLKLLYHTCRGVLEPNKLSFERTGTATAPPWLPGAAPVVPVVAPSAPSPSQEDAEIAMAIAASLHSAIEEGIIPLSAVSLGSPEDRKGCVNVHYPPVDTSPVNVLPTTVVEGHRAAAGEGTSGSDSSCVICADAPVEAACVPCGHMAGCMTCLNEVKMKEIGCPVCRADIERIMKIYTV